MIDGPHKHGSSFTLSTPFVVRCNVVLTIRLLTAFILGCVSAHFRLPRRSAFLKETCNICRKCFSTSVSSFGWPCECRCHRKPPPASKRFKRSFIFQPNSLRWWPNIFATQTYAFSPKYRIAWHSSHARSISWGRASSCLRTLTRSACVMGVLKPSISGVGPLGFLQWSG